MTVTRIEILVDSKTRLHKETETHVPVSRFPVCLTSLIANKQISAVWRMPGLGTGSRGDEPEVSSFVLRKNIRLELTEGSHCSARSKLFFFYCSCGHKEAAFGCSSPELGGLSWRLPVSEQLSCKAQGKQHESVRFCGCALSCLTEKGKVALRL